MTTLTTASTDTTNEPILTDEMLQRFGQRAPTYDRENRFFHEDFDELRAAGYLKLAGAEGPRRPRPVAGRGLPSSSAGWPTARRPPRWRSTCTSTGRASRPTCGACGDTLARVAAARSGGRRGLRRRPRRDAATTCRCCCRPPRPSASTAATASPATRCSAASARSGRGSACTRMDTSDPTRAEDRPRLHAARHAGLPHRRDVGHAGHARHAQRRHRTSKARSSPIGTSPASCRPGRSIRSSARSSPTRC